MKARLVSIRPTRKSYGVHTLMVRLRSLTGTSLRSPVSAPWPGKLIDCALKLVSVAFLACGSFLPTLSLALLKSMPTPGFFLRFFGIFVQYRESLGATVVLYQLRASIERRSWAGSWAGEAAKMREAAHSNLSFNIGMAMLECDCIFEMHKSS